MPAARLLLAVALAVPPAAPAGAAPESPRFTRLSVDDGLSQSSVQHIVQDHFKSINDRHSHAVGDRVLSRIAGVLKEHVRGSDLAVRWGGDEFLVVTRSFQRDHAGAARTSGSDQTIRFAARPPGRGASPGARR